MALKKYELTDDEKQMLIDNDISIEHFRSRVNRGWTKQRALTQSVTKQRQYTNLTLDERKNMIRQGITESMYQQRLNNGWDEQVAKTKPPQKNANSHRYQQFNDYELEYLLINHISYKDFKNRRQLGWTREEAIFIPKGIKRHEVLKHDLYPLTREELKTIYQHATTVDTYRARRHMGWTKERALKTPKRLRRKA